MFMISFFLMPYDGYVKPASGDILKIRVLGSSSRRRIR
jgi:hypothetical protein